MKRILFALPFLLSLDCQATTQQPLTPDQTQEMLRRSSMQGSTVSSYIPRQVDVSRFLRLESRCYMFIGRCVLQPINVVAPLVATGLVAASNICQDSYPTTSKIFGWTGCALSALEFATSVLLLKVNDKLQGIDEYIESQKVYEKATAMAAEIIAESSHSSETHTTVSSTPEQPKTEDE